jgi:hypothetical protein
MCLQRVLKVRGPDDEWVTYWETVRVGEVRAHLQKHLNSPRFTQDCEQLVLHETVVLMAAVCIW